MRMLAGRTDPNGWDYRAQVAHLRDMGPVIQRESTT
jgi:hypothetical protein